MKFESEELKTSFTVPDRPNVRQVLQWEGGIAGSLGEADMFNRLWLAALPLVSDWQSELLPDPHGLKLEESEDYALIPLIKWVGMAVFSHVNGLKNVPKN